MPRKHRTVSETLRQAVRQAIKEQYSYRELGRLAGITNDVVQRFATIEDYQIRGESIDRLAEVLGLELRRRDE